MLRAGSKRILISNSLIHRNFWKNKCPQQVLPLNKQIIMQNVSQYSVVSLVIRLRTGRSGVWIPKGVRYFRLLQHVQTGSGAHPTTIQYEQDPLPRVNKSGRKVDHLTPAFTEVKNEWSYNFAPLIRFHGFIILHASIYCNFLNVEKMLATCVMRLYGPVCVYVA
jgi:hypothetical protein